MPAGNAPINVRLRGEGTKGRLVATENRPGAPLAGPPLHVADPRDVLNPNCEICPRRGML